MDPVRINEEHEQCTADGDRREHGYSDTKTEREGEPLHRRTAQKKRMQEVMITVIFASKMVTNARLKPDWTASLSSLPDAISSLNRSKMRTFASTAIPMDRMTPATLGSVSVACKDIQDAQKDEDIHKKRHIRDKAGHTVHGQHENNDQRETDGESHDGLILRVLSKRRPTVRTSMTETLTGSAPLRRRIARSFASSSVLCPVMTAEPPVMASLTTGFVRSSPSR